MSRFTRFALLALLLTICLAATSFALAQTSTELNVMGFNVTLEEQGTPLDQAYQKFLSDFQTAHPGVTVNSLDTPPDFDTQLLVDLAAGTAPDVWSQDGSTLARLVDSGNVLDMKECQALVPEFNFDRFFPSTLAIHQRTPDGPVYGVPNDFTPMMIYYNTESFQKANVPLPQDGWTWDQFVDTAQKLTLDSAGHNAQDPAFDPTNVVQWGYRVRQYLTFEGIYRLWENGGDILSPDGTTASGYLDSPESIEAIKWLRDKVTVQHVAPPPDALAEMLQSASFVDKFLAGDVAMYDRGLWELVGLQSNAAYKPGIFGIVGQPVGTTNATILYTSGFVIRANIPEEKKLAACQFVEAATSRAYQDTKALTGIAISANQEAAAAMAASTDSPFFKEAVDNVQFGRPPSGALYKQWPDIETLLNSTMEHILAGESVEDQVASAVSDINRILSQ